MDFDKLGQGNGDAVGSAAGVQRRHSSQRGDISGDLGNDLSEAGGNLGKGSGVGDRQGVGRSLEVHGKIGDLVDGINDSLASVSDSASGASVGLVARVDCALSHGEGTVEGHDLVHGALRLGGDEVDDGKSNGVNGAFESLEGGGDGNTSDRNAFKDGALAKNNLEKSLVDVDELGQRNVDCSSVALDIERLQRGDGAEGACNGSHNVGESHGNLRTGSDTSRASTDIVGRILQSHGEIRDLVDGIDD